MTKHEDKQLAKQMAIKLKNKFRRVLKSLDTSLKDKFKDDATSREMLHKKVEGWLMEKWDIKSILKVRVEIFKDMANHQINEFAKEIEEERRATKLLRSNYIG